MANVVPTSRATIAPAVALDLFERFTLLALFLRLLVLNYHAVMSTGHWFNWLMVLSEGLGVFFIMTRKPATMVTDNPSDWTVAFFATAGPLLVHPAGFAPIAPAWLGVSLLLLGLIVQISAKLSLRRSFGIVPANRGVKMGGPYRYVRHPMYLGYLGVHIGFLLVTPSLWNLTVYGVSVFCQVVRILAEERLLNADPQYQTFRSAVRWRLVPGVF